MLSLTMERASVIVATQRDYLQHLLEDLDAFRSTSRFEGLSESLNMDSVNLKDESLHLTLRLLRDEGDQEEKRQKDTVHLVKSDSEAVESHASSSPALPSDNTGGPQTTRSASKAGAGPAESQVERETWAENSSCSLLMEVTTVEDHGDLGGAKEQGAAIRKPIPPISRGKRRGIKRMVPMVRLLSWDFPEKGTEVSANLGNLANRRGRKKILDSPVALLGHSEGESGSDSIPMLPVKRSTRKKRELFPTDLPAKRPYRKRKMITKESDDTAISAIPEKRRLRKRKVNLPPAKEDDDTEANSIIFGRGRPGRRSRLPVEIPPELLKEPRGEKMIYRCSVCGKDFPHAYKLERHELTHTGEKPYCCSLCGRGFNQKGNLKTHYKVHTGRKGDIGDWAGGVSPTLLDIPEYPSSGMATAPPLCCLQCGTLCDSASALEAHRAAAHDPRPASPPAPAPAACPLCGLQCGDRGQLEAHVKAHARERPYSCPDCGKRFISQSYVQVHRRIHTGERPHRCSQCSKGYHTASSLRLHQMQHSGERPFACALCGKRFRINSYLTAHYQTHSKDRPFRCGACGKGYTRAEELKVHQRLHTGERPYRCDECGKSFIYRQGLRQHQRTHAGRRIGPTRQLGRPRQQPRQDH